MTRQLWRYPEDLVEALLAYGLRPTPATPPLLVRSALNDLYRYEIKRLRQRLLDGRVEKARYVEEVITLRKRYWPLSLQAGQWERIVTRVSPAPSADPP